MSVETREFQAEARQLLQLMVHSVYSNKDIFLRELISNASDALDKLRLEKLLNEKLEADVSDLHIELMPDKDNRTLVIRDNGIGMNREEVITLIGTIAKSGTAEYLAMMREKKEQPSTAELIGQFGVGFYSCFMVADKVTLRTRRAGETQGTRWESEGDGKYTIEDLESTPQGTEITLHLKTPDPEDGLHDYTDPWKLREIVKHYSDFIAYPIRMETTRKEVDRDKDGKPLEGAIPRTVTDNETLNSQKAIWTRSKDEVKPEEYNEFYKHVSHDWSDPMRTITLKAEGTFEYQALLFIPSHAPFDLYMRDGKRGVQLYVKRVFIMDDCEELMPEYLRFVRGVVDAQDLSLNVSREILQQDRHVQLMRKRLIKKVLDTAREMLEGERETYLKFWKEFGRVLKEGLYLDAENRNALLEISLFPSSHSDKLTTLKEYISRMKEGQEAIYFLTGENRGAVENSPLLERFKEKGYEVLLLSDPVDSLWVDTVHEFEGKKLQSIAKGDIELGSEEEKKQQKAEREEKSKTFAALLSWLTGQLSADVKEARLSNRLTSSPACLVSDEHDVSPALERLMRATGQEPPKVKRILEINPAHPLIEKLHALYEAKSNDVLLHQTAEVLYGLAVLAEGGELADPNRFTKMASELLVKAL
ncbi:MAG: molecular chaperone HtpG [Candidatus Xenobia bacterium]